MNNTIKWHLGLGDAIICAPIVIRYLSDGDFIQSTHQNQLSVHSMFLNHGIEVTTEPKGEPVLRLGYESNIPMRDGESFDRWFFRQAGMDISDRSLCPITNGVWRKTEQLPVPEEEYIFVHHDSSRGFTMDLNKIRDVPRIVFPYHRGQSILAYADIINNASEVHCIDSSFLHLADRLNPKGRLVWHRYPRAYKITKGLYQKHKWEIIE